MKLEVFKFIWTLLVGVVVGVLITGVAVSIFRPERTAPKSPQSVEIFRPNTINIERSDYDTVLYIRYNDSIYYLPAYKGFK